METDGIVAGHWAGRREKSGRHRSPESAQSVVCGPPRTPWVLYTTQLATPNRMAAAQDLVHAHQAFLIVLQPMACIPEITMAGSIRRYNRYRSQKIMYVNSELRIGAVEACVGGRGGTVADGAVVGQSDGSRKKEVILPSTLYSREAAKRPVSPIGQSGGVKLPLPSLSRHFLR